MTHRDVTAISIPLPTVGAPIKDLPKTTAPANRPVGRLDPRPLQRATTGMTPELLTCLTLEVTALGAAGHTSESGNVEIPLLELPLADGNSRQLCLHLNSEPAVQEMPCFTGYVGSRSGVLEP
jgi:hypothetical protein